MASVCAILVSIMIMTSQLSNAAFEELKEPVCSKYAFEERLLERSVRTDHAVQMMDQKIGQWEAKMEKTLDLLKQHQDKLERTQQTVIETSENAIAGIQEKANTMVNDVQKQMTRMSSDLLVDRRDINETLKGFLENTTAMLDKTKDELVAPAVAFFATDIANHSPTSGSLIRFTNAKVNVAGGYNVGTGYFTAPYDGVYMFTVQICSDYNQYIDIQIVVAGSAVAGLRHYYTGNIASAACTSGVAMTTLKVGNQVNLKMSARSSSGFLVYSSTAYTSSFSGFLVSREAP